MTPPHVAHVRPCRPMSRQTPWPAAPCQTALCLLAARGSQKLRGTGSVIISVPALRALVVSCELLRRHASALVRSHPSTTSTTTTATTTTTPQAHAAPRLGAKGSTLAGGAVAWLNGRLSWAAQQPSSPAASPHASPRPERCWWTKPRECACMQPLTGAHQIAALAPSSTPFAAPPPRCRACATSRAPAHRESSE